jgi:hypothetical protein
MWELAGGFSRSASRRIAQARTGWTKRRGYRFGVEVFGARSDARAAYPPVSMVTFYFEERSGFAGGIRGSRESPATGRGGLRAMQVAQADYRPSREGREVKA